MNLTKKKLLILYTKSPDEVYNRKSAIGSYVHCLADLLSANFDVTLNYKQSEPNASLRLKSNDSNSTFSKLKKRIPKKIKSYLRDKKHFAALKELTNKVIASGIQFDVILEFYNYGSDVGLKLSEHFKCPLNLIYDGPIFEEYTFFNGHNSPFEKLCKKLEKDTFQKATKIVVYSQPMIDFCIKNIHEQREKYHVHQNVDFSRFHFFEQEKDYNNGINICFIGSFLKWHRVDLLLKAYYKITHNLIGTVAHLYLIGDGEEKSKIEKLVSDIGLNNFVTFTGFVDGEELMELQKKMHIGVMPSSNWYGAPNKLFEYGAMKLACVAPDTPTIRSIFGNDNLCSFMNENGEDLYSQLKALCENIELVRTKSNRSFEFISKHYSKENTLLFYQTFLSNS